ncbi:MAG: aldehyde ferredoxin oxidoreductase N-terminal domain-containing protein [Methanolobus sp.]
MFGWTGRTVIVDLGKKSVTETRTKKSFAEDFIGGRGLGCRLMKEFAEPEVEPLSQSQYHRTAYGNCSALIQVIFLSPVKSPSHPQFSVPMPKLLRANSNLQVLMRMIKGKAESCLSSHI